MKNFLVALTLAIVCLVPALAPAQTSLYAPSQQVRASGVLTTSDVLSTTFTIPADAKAVHFYVDFTKGSLDSATFAPAGAMDGNPAATGYYKTTGKAENYTATGRFHIRVPREEFGAYRYGGIFTVGTGTTTSSNALIRVKFEL